MKLTISRREVITYNNDTWEVEVTENAHEGVDYTIYQIGNDEPIMKINTNNLVKLQQIIGQIIPNIHNDRVKLLS